MASPIKNIDKRSPVSAINDEKVIEAVEKFRV